MKRGLYIFITLILFGLLDLATTVVGVTFFDAKETNPLLMNIVVTNPLFFGLIKLLAVATTGLMFYKAGNAEIAGQNVTFGNNLLHLSQAFALVFLAAIVTNNIIVLVTFS